MLLATKAAGGPANAPVSDEAGRMSLGFAGLWLQRVEPGCCFFQLYIYIYMFVSVGSCS